VTWEVHCGGTLEKPALGGEARPDGQLRRRVAGRSQTDSAHLQERRTLAFPLEEMGDSDARTPTTGPGRLAPRLNGNRVLTFEKET
jgi:hypothetical protein